MCAPAKAPPAAAPVKSPTSTPNGVRIDAPHYIGSRFAAVGFKVTGVGTNAATTSKEIITNPNYNRWDNRSAATVTNTFKHTGVGGNQRVLTDTADNAPPARSFAERLVPRQPHNGIDYSMAGRPKPKTIAEAPRATSFKAIKQSDGSFLGAETTRVVNGITQRGRTKFSGRPQGGFGVFKDGSFGKPKENDFQALATSYRKTDTRHIKTRPRGAAKSSVARLTGNGVAARREGTSGLNVGGAQTTTGINIPK